MTSREKTIASIVSAKFGISVPDVDRGLVFWRDLSAGCIEMAEIGFALEEAFGFEILDEDLDRLHCVGDIHSLVEDRLDGCFVNDRFLAMAA